MVRQLRGVDSTMSKRRVFDKGDFSENYSGKGARGADIISRWDQCFGPDPDDPTSGYKSRSLLRLDKRPQRSNLTQRQNLPELSSEEEVRLLVAAQAGDDNATRTLILHHLPWEMAQAESSQKPKR
jgi:hypothetical protein